MKGEPWNEGEENLLRFMWLQAGMTVPQMAPILKRPQGGVTSKIAKLGLCGKGRMAQGGVPKWKPFQNPDHPCSL